MQIELYFAPGACSFVPHAGLEVVKAATGQDFTPHMVKLHKGEHKTPEYLAMNPEGLVPVLKVDGHPLTQIVAICDFMDRSFPQAGLLPSDAWARAQAMSRFAWMNNTEQYRKHLARIEHMVEHAGTPYLLGDRVSFLDAYALTLLRWGGYAGIDPESLPKLWAHVQRVADTAPVAAAIERERLQLNVYKKA